MAGQDFTYKKISQLPNATNIAPTDVLINANGVTSKVTWSKLLQLINTDLTDELSALTDRITAVETNYTTLASATSDNSATISNIITAGFNLIGVE